jgi:ribonuclease HII
LEYLLSGSHLDDCVIKERTMPSSRVFPRLHIEHDLWQNGLQLVAGVDEVGMGPLAGPVVAAAVIFPPQQASIEVPSALPQGVRDSKMLTLKARERLEQEIRHTALSVGVGIVEVEEIDRLNIYHAGLKAMRLALEHLPLFPEHVLVDGRSLKNLPCPCSTFIKGDREVYSIAAASIIAKVFRDRLMINLDQRYPEYGFARHMGYGTVAHREAIRRFGPSPVHRQSFRLL